ncbi:tRNA (adenosine(37)-N6)-threonylcarbamoyltransferase complex dimerization subunit type 1 TsaB [Paenibacillus sp. TRM 82003]|nr:tRNA (adenosine(37)-N6)-threonylcarbamoyltransferase complex dimerization subunit type 1 TsaB [Paenibacillus sp. TRM 82003]
MSERKSGGSMSHGSMSEGSTSDGPLSGGLMSDGSRGPEQAGVGRERASGFPDGPVLAIDTATSSMTACVVDGETVLAERMVSTERNHSVHLLPEIEALVAGVGLRPRDLRAVVVGNGPGSYTGVRIGVTVAKTFAWALGIPVYAVSSLEALAYGGWRDAAAASPTVQAPAWVVPALDGRRGQAYTALFAVGVGVGGGEVGVGFAGGAAGDGDGELGGWSRVAADAVVPFAGQAAAWLGAAGRPGTVVFCGEVDGGFADMLDAAAAGADAVVLRRPWALAARDIAAVARMYGDAARVDEPFDLLPNYTQLAEAEAKLLSAGAGAERKDN